MKTPTFARLVDQANPNRFVSFKSALHDRRVAAALGAALGVCFFVCFFTGLISHYMQHPPTWFAWPSRPAGFYRVTQGLHVASGLFSIPILLAKLWTIYPKLFEWPPVVSVAHALERLSLLPLIGGGLFMLTTGVANINQWYFFPFSFTSVHYAIGWVTIGALVVHIGAKWTITRSSLRPGALNDDTAEPSERALQDDADERVDVSTYATGNAITRRGFVYGVFGVGGLITLFSVGQSFSPLGRLALLSPRRPGVGPQSLPVNRSASAAGIIEMAQRSDFVLHVDGAKALTFTLEELRALPQRSAELPIACVEGWSASAQWRGVAIRDLMALADAPKNASVRVESMEQGSPYSSSVLDRHHANDPDTLLALELNGKPLHIDHGYPCRLIAPNRPGVLQTKWVQRLVIS